MILTLALLLIRSSLGISGTDKEEDPDDDDDKY
jgi:hypothetical protein